MNIGQFPFIDFPSIGTAMNAVHGQRISLPVSPSQYMYSHFRHVSGVPAPEGVEGLSIAKLHIIDAILNELSRLRQIPKPSFDIQGSTPDEQMNSLVAHFQAQVHEAYAARAETPYSNNIPAPQVGATLSLNF